MINLVLGQSNEIVVTATEKVTIVNPYFLFVFKHQQSLVTVTTLLTNTSIHTSRYDSFNYTPDLEKGTHYYTIYAQTSAVNIDPSLADEVVETGIVNVTDTVTAAAQYEENNEYQTYGG